MQSSQSIAQVIYEVTWFTLAVMTSNYIESNKSPADLNPEFLRVSDAAKIYALSKAKLYSLMSEGKITYVSLRERGKVRGVRLIKADSIKHFMEARLVKADDE
ncbi:helix-turn-helix domain-containing protein [Verrucomicrobiaceae bacterium R5-34]|nr:helix-turn-helix domain-containing protein [Verrucomicrobiaceae bacterium R5-34]